MKVAYFLSHPIQYQTPMLREFVAAGLDVVTVYGDVSTAGAYFDRDYQQVISWEKPLLEGYPHEVLEAPTWENWPWAWKKVAEVWLKRCRPNVVWVHGWGTAFALGALMAAHACGVPILLRGETHLRCLKPGILWHWLHRAVLSRVFTQVDQFLAIGSANREFYRSYGVAEDRISLVPYVTDNEHFQRACLAAAAGREEFRRSLGLEQGRPVLLFIGRLSWEKNLPTLFEAMRLLQQELPQESRPILLIGGEGPFSKEIRALAAERAGEDVRFLGFTQQSRLPALFDVSDALVLPSSIEPWGMVVNEAMNAGLPLILSDRVGSWDDLLRHGENGVVFETMNPRSLADAIRRVTGDPAFAERAGRASLRCVNQWGPAFAAQGLREALEKVDQRRGGVNASVWSAPARRSGIELAYIGVHEVFQLAIAAQEMGELRGLQCSVIDGPGKLGRLASRFIRLPSAHPLGCEILPPEKTIELSLPLASLRLAGWARGAKVDPTRFHSFFEHLAARRLAHSDAGIVVGAETCSRSWFEAAKRRGMKCVLDAHGIPAPFLDAARRRGAEEFGLPVQQPCDSPEMTWHKQQERNLADVILLCSEMQKEAYASIGEDVSRMRPVPLWLDTSFWFESKPRPPAVLPLRIMFAGTATLAKGIPYLLKALEQTGDAVHLSIVGPLAGEIRHLAEPVQKWLTVLPYKSREELRDFYATQHLLVLPSLGDSFGFVALEAMACGLPVILTNHCGAPVPHPSWRVPTHDAQALADRLMWYAADAARVDEDSRIARAFAAQFPPSEYRRKVREIYEELLAA
ncbi:MAG: glycosyltransferase family 4 protein [Verrucomicrobiaceae bacterium]|nr:glycosyltransferase family 4 protein [Verrucomicrobiaceae bacterium]